MVISQKRFKELYKSIRGPIVDLRIEANGGLNIEGMDSKLLHLETEIYKKVAKSLNLQNNAGGV